MNVISGINFFNDRVSCLSELQKTSWLKRAISFFKSFGSSLFYVARVISLVWKKTDKKMEPLGDGSREFFRKRLVVCIHGLSGRPSRLKSIVDELEKREKIAETDLFVPAVLKGGNANLDDLVAPILEVINRWKERGGEELVLVGVSNGARIARAIDAKIEGISRVRFISIVGAAKGSFTANLLKKCGLAWTMAKPIAEEMPRRSPRNEQLHSEWKQALARSSITREYTFIASAHDWLVPNRNSTLLKVPAGHQARYGFVFGHGHNSVVHAVAKAVAQIALPD